MPASETHPTATPEKPTLRRRLAAVPGAVPAHVALQSIRGWLRFARETLAQVVDGRLTYDLVERALDPLRDAFAVPEAWLVYEDGHVRRPFSAGVSLSTVSRRLQTLNRKKIRSPSLTT